MPTHNLRIAVVGTHPPGTGTLNEYGFHFVRHLRHKAEVDEVILLTDELPNGMAYEPASKLRIVPCWKFDGFTNAARILSAIKREKPDAVLFNIQFASFGRGKVPATLGLATPALARMAGFPTVVLLHNIMETVDLKRAGFGGNPLVEKVIRAFGNVVTRTLLQAHIVALTIPKYVEIIESKYGAKNVLLAPHGAFEDSPAPLFEPPPGPLQIMTFGKFGTYKRVEVLIEALKLLRQDHVQRPPLEVVVAGTDSPNSAGYLEGIRKQYADVPNIRMTGYVAEEDVPKVFGDAAVVVFPYNSTTGSSGVLHQAGTYGRAVVMPQLGDLAELIQEEGYAGEFFTPEDPRSLADAIARVIDNPEHRRALGRRNYLASQGLPMSDVVDWYLLHIEELIKQRGARTPAAAGA